MKNIKLMLVAFILLGAFISTVPAVATPVAVISGDLLQFNGQIPGASSGGGLFSFTDVTGGFDFLTFCLEKDEYLSPNSLYIADVNIGAIYGGVDETPADATPNLDELDSKTAWLFDQYMRGLISPGPSQQAMQDAIWYIEDEQTSQGAGAALIASIPGTSGLYGVSVLNLWSAIPTVGAPGYTRGTEAQDVLFTPVPEPSTILLLGLGLTGIGLVTRKRTKN